MTKPRIFVSSTYYDLKHIRSSLETFIENMGYDPILFESGDIPYKSKDPLDISCYEEIDSCHMFILIIGGRYGSPSSEDRNNKEEENKVCTEYNSVTMEEYLAAREKEIPIFIFVEKNVYSEYRTYKENRDSAFEVKYAYVDNVNVFKLLDEINSQDRNNTMRDFDKFEDISNWLRDQWAGLFADYLLKQRNNQILENMSTKIEKLSQITATLQEYTEIIMRKVEPDNSDEIIRKENEKIEEYKQEYFASDDLIQYIMIADIKLKIEDVYSVFKKGKSFEDFLEEIGFDREGEIKLQDHLTAQNKYKKLSSQLTSGIFL